MQTTSGPTANPFKMPTDEEVFILRDEEKRQKALERERLKYQSVQDKGVSHGHSVLARFNAADEQSAIPGQTFSGDVTLPTIEKRVSDNMAQYIMKKRKMGLARMALATKRQEIKKLDEEAERAERRVAQMEAQLRETEGKFRAFLQHSEMEQVEAFKRAESETKAKQEKIQEIKKLSAQIAQIETDKRKNEEQLHQCQDFKTFLDQLAPPQFFQQSLSDTRKEDYRLQVAAQFEQEFNDMGFEGASEAEEQERRQTMQQQLERQCIEFNAQVDREADAMDPDDVKDAVDSLDPDRVPMYFTDPAQIQQKFIEIEEGNLFLITTCQELEEEIEGIASQYKHEQQQMVELAQARKQQMDGINKKIEGETQKKIALEERLKRAHDSGNGPTQEELKEQIEERVRRTYKTLRLGEDANIGTLGMLTQIEVRLEEMRLQIVGDDDHAGIDRSFVTALMKVRDRERRQAARQDLLNKQKEEQDKRSRKALERSQAPVKKRVGKPVMWRSRPPDNKKQEASTAVETTGNEEDEFLS